MKIYIVTSGIYSDYHINRVFLDKNKANEYAEWLGDDHVTVEEYDTSDNDTIEKQYKVRIDLKWYPNKEEKLIARSWKDCESDYNYNYYSNYSDIWEELVVVRTVNGENFNEHYWEDKLTKYAYDLKAQIEYLKSEGFDEKSIQKMI